MPRSLTTATKQALLAQETDQVFLVLLTISHADLASPIRVVNNQTDIVSGGDTYLAFPFQLELPSDSEELPPQGILIIDNVDRTIVQAIRSMTGVPADVTIEIIRAADPDDIEITASGFKLREVQYNELTVTGQLIFERFELEAYPTGRIVPKDFPGVF